MTDCVITQPIARPGTDLLRAAGLAVFEAPAPDLPTLRPHLATARAVITRDSGLSAEAIAAAPNLRIIASHGTGTDRIDIEAAHRRGIRVENTPGANAGSVAEHALGLILICARRIVPADHAVRQGNWAIRDTLRPRDLDGATLGLVGFGHVARRLAALAGGIGMRVVVHSAHADPAELAAAGIGRAADLDALLAEAEVVSLHGRPGMAPVLDAGAIARMRPGAILVNTARGALVDETALAAALRAGRIAAAALDVCATEPPPPDSPLLTCPNLVLTPHIAGLGDGAMDRTALEVARKVVAALGLPVTG